MALLVIQVAPVVLLIIDFDISSTNGITLDAVDDLIVSIHEMLNVTTSSVMAILCFTDNMDLARVYHLPSSWCGCQWDCLSMTNHLW